MPFPWRNWWRGGHDGRLNRDQRQLFYEFCLDEAGWPPRALRECNSTYPRILSRRRWTYLLTDVEEERLAGRLRCFLPLVRVLVFGVCVLVILASASGLGETVGCRLAGCVAAIVPRDASVDGRARSSHRHRPFIAWSSRCSVLHD